MLRLLGIFFNLLSSINFQKLLLKKGSSLITIKLLSFLVSIWENKTFLLQNMNFWLYLCIHNTSNNDSFFRNIVIDPDKERKEIVLRYYFYCEKSAVDIILDQFPNFPNSNQTINF